LRRRWYPYALIGPVVLLVAAGIVYPLVYLVYLSTQDYSPFYHQTMTFAGLANYIKLLHDPLFWSTLQASVIWVVGSVVPQFVIGLGLALLLNEHFPGNGFARSIVLLPWAISGVITGIIWTWLFDGTVGVINDLLMRAHVVSLPIAWSVVPATTWAMVLIANTWRGAPFFAIVLLAAMQSIGPELYEAAKVDGAGRLDRFRFISFPLILNAVILSTLLRSIWTFNYVDMLWTMTHGGPVNTTRTLPIDILHTAYIDGDFGYATALSIALVCLLLVFSAVYWQLNRLVSTQMDDRK
jgi:multiple sugar transport system permease protein